MVQKSLEAKAELLKVLAHPTRLAIVELLAQGERCVCEIQPALGIGQPNLSQHLSLMKKQGVIESRKDGQRTFYKLRHRQVLDISALAGDVIANQLLDD
jgi:ArsR family transcriptional regulator